MCRRLGRGIVVMVLLAGCREHQDDSVEPGNQGGVGGRGTGGGRAWDGGSSAGVGGAIQTGGTGGGDSTGAAGAAGCGAPGASGASGASEDGGSGNGTGGVADAGACTGSPGDWMALPAFPPALAVPAGAMLKSHAHGSGVQIYTCTAGGGADGGAQATYAWLLKAPRATLFDGCGQAVATHAAGPSWTSTVDGSAVQGVKVLQADAPQAAAIPWLLLRATATVGTGAFGDVTYVQRLATVGGKAPAAGCDATTVGVETDVPYSADYYFYSGGAGAAWLLPPQVPPAIAAPSGTVVKLHDHAVGAQVYICTAGGGGDGGAPTYAWVLEAPDAILYDATFAPVGAHGAGPHWTSSDGSTVVGVKVAQANAPLPGAIPWLLLQASSTTGSGTFADVAFVQRLNTVGGQAPGTGCDAATVGTESRVDYSADYYFFTSLAVDGGAGTGGTGGTGG